jgi:hypothetical protein
MKPARQVVSDAKIWGNIQMTNNLGQTGRMGSPLAAANWINRTF